VIKDLRESLDNKVCQDLLEDMVIVVKQESQELTVSKVFEESPVSKGQLVSQV